jgi:inward rectifier potassium channel
MALWKRQPKVGPDDVEVVGAPRPLLADAYHELVRARWPTTLAALALGFLLENVLFGLAFFAVGGIAGAGGLRDAFFFSVQTSGTIGYGAMYPVSAGAHALVAVESFVSIVLVALTTGLVFAKFSAPRARVRFAAHPVVAPYDGVPTMMFRLGNQRDSRLVEATLRVVAIRTERTSEGVTYYRMYDLPLERERSPALTRSWTALYRLLPGTPLHGASPESLARDEVELILTLTGIDEVSAQTHHAQRRYVAAEVRFGVRHADMLSELPDGRLRLDLSRFDDVIATVPTPEFPYGAAQGG